MSEIKKDLIDVKHLSVTFYNGMEETQAVEDVTFKIKEGEILGVVGESGSGKTVSAMSIMRLIPFPPGKITGGDILYRGEDILKKSEKEMRKIRGNKISMIFQEPMTSFDPLFTIGYQIEEAIMLHQHKTRNEAYKMSIELLHEVGIAFPEKRVNEYPHQMSGGMLQRAMIAMALSCNPELLIADEPTTALDVTIQAQILDLIRRLQFERGMSILMITHDLGVIAETAKYVIVMYAGRVVEEAKAEALFENPLHPYTDGLMKSIPKIGNYEKLYMIPYKSGANKIKQGCRFSTRCEYAFERCALEEPDLVDIGDSRKIRCWKVFEEYEKGNTI